MGNLWIHFKRYFFRGVIAAIPAGLTAIVIYFLYNLIDQSIVRFIDKYIQINFPGLGFLLLIVCLYLIGLVTSNFIGRWTVNKVESVLSRIPIVKVTYKVGKQFANTISLSDKQVFQKAVLVDYFKPGVRVVGFVTGQLKNKKTDEELLKIFIPMAINPTSGFMVIISETDIIDPGWSVEEAMKIVVSGGIIGPDSIYDTAAFQKICDKKIAE